MARLTAFAITPTGVEVLLGLRRGESGVSEGTLLIIALPPIATAKADSRKRSCPLYPRKRTCAVQLQMSALGQ
jgi:hypothetical protein